MYVNQHSSIYSAEEACSDVFKKIDDIAEINAYKVMASFSNHRVSEMHFVGSTGYGYDDIGRDTLDKVFADIVGAEDALVRHNFVSGTHALTTALFGVLRPGDTFVSLTGTPYDTLIDVIHGENIGSLKDFGVKYKEIAMTDDGLVDKKKISSAVKDVKVAYIQRSRGYSLRKSVSISEIQEIVQIIKTSNPNAIIMVDNCYGEFVEEKEPTEIGCDLIIGSLIKNPGGGIAKTGGYIAGRSDLVSLCANRLTSPGVGREVGCSLGETRNMLMGLFFAPTVVASALKTAALASKLFSDYGYHVTPHFDEHRTDIIQAIELGSEEKLIRFCVGIQKASPVDSFVSPVPWAMPGYQHQIIMAAGAFTMGASIELSADAPVKEPYVVWMQGGLTYPAGKLGVVNAAKALGHC